jgi:hypothetical protein
MDGDHRLGGAAMLLATGIVSMMIVERLHDQRTRTESSAPRPHVLLSDSVLPALTPHLAQRASSQPRRPAMRIAGRTDGGALWAMVAVGTEETSRCGVCSEAPAPSESDDSCW